MGDKKNKKVLYEVETQIKYCSIEKIQSVLNAHEADIRSYAYTIHDKDIGKDGKSVVEAHVHCMLRLNESRRRADVASWFGLPESCIQDSRTNDYGDMLLYLIHENAPEKYQYSELKVKANFDYSRELSRIREKAKRRVRTESILRAIAEGTIREYNIQDFVTVEEYDKIRGRIRNAFEYRRTILEQQNTREMEVIYIYGDGGTGKSTYAEEIARRRGYSYKRSASERDPLGSYKGQDAFILDDVRGNTFNFQDWMGILDNHQDRAGGSRYYDKNFTECRLLMITVPDSPEKFFKELSEGRKDEDPHQFYRRIRTVIHMTRDKILCKRYDEVNKCYGREYELENNTFSKFSLHSENEDEQKEKLAQILGIDKSAFDAKIEVEVPEGLEPLTPEQLARRRPPIRLLDDEPRFYLIVDNADPKIKEEITAFANTLQKKYITEVGV